MTIAFKELQSAHLSYSAIFFCIFAGFIFLKLVYKQEPGILFWAVSALCNSIGFLLWSGVIISNQVLYYLGGEIFHMLGFFLLVFGALVFAKIYKIKKFIILLSLILIIIWFGTILVMGKAPMPAMISLKIIRAIIFIVGGVGLLVNIDKNEFVGKIIASLSLLLWSTYMIVSSFIKINSYVFFGFLIGFHVLSYFGMVAMIIDKIRIKSEEMEIQVNKLEGILPICSYCKKIRDSTNNWKILEEYIEERSEAEFSHGICPDCFEKHRPDK